MTENIVTIAAVMATLRRYEQKNKFIPELVEEAVWNLPRVDFDKVDKVGNWVKMQNGSIQSCETCGRWQPIRFNFCPCCGAPAESHDPYIMLQKRREAACRTRWEKGWADCDDHCPLHVLREPGKTCSWAVYNKPDQAQEIMDKIGV